MGEAKGVSEMSESIEFHDALLLDISVNVANKEILVRPSLFPVGKAIIRSVVDLRFNGVFYFSLIADLGELEQNAFAGHVVDARLPEDGQTTRIYLTGGILIIQSLSVAVNPKSRAAKDPDMTADN